MEERRWKTPGFFLERTACMGVSIHGVRTVLHNRQIIPSPCLFLSFTHTQALSWIRRAAGRQCCLEEGFMLLGRSHPAMAVLYLLPLVSWGLWRLLSRQSTDCTHGWQRSPELYTGLAPAVWRHFQMSFWAVTQATSKQIYLHSLSQSLKHRGRGKSSSLVCTEDDGLYCLSPPSFPVKEGRFFPSDSLVVFKVSKDNFRAVGFQSVLDLNKHPMWTAV